MMWIHDGIEKLTKIILNLTSAEARDIGIKHRIALKKIKDRKRVYVEYEGDD